MQKSFVLALCFLGFLCFSEAVTVRFLNACPNCNDMDFYVDGFPLVRNVGSLELSRGIFARPGNRRIEVRHGGIRAVLSFKVNVNLEHPLTIAVINHKDKLNYYIVTDYDIGTGVEFFRGAVKAVNLCPNCPMLEGIRTNKPSDCVWPGMSYLARTWYRDLPDGDGMALSFRDSETHTTITTATVDIQQLRAYTVFIVGDYNTGVKTIVATDVLGREFESDGPLVPYTNSQLEGNTPAITTNLYGCPK